MKNLKTTMPVQGTLCTPEKGAALILFLTILVLGTMTILLSELNRSHFQIKSQKQTASVLAQAKAALLGFALTYAETHQGQMQGYLPCPDHNGDGSADPSCSTKYRSVVGRFPWRTLGLPPLRDGSGECLWYAVSGTYKDNPKQILTNTTPGLFIVKNAQGDTMTDKAIAIIFAPGSVIDGQNRTVTVGNATECGSEVINEPVDPINDINNYFDHYNYNGLNINNATGSGSLSFVPSESGNSGFFATSEPPHTATFIKAPVTTNVIFNDTLMLITPKDFASVYERMNYWVAKQVVKCLENYAGTNNSNNKFPWASKIDPYDYSDDSGERFGRIPDAPLNATHGDNSDMSKTWTTDCFDEDSGLDNWKWGWWQKWKEMVFFAVNSADSPPVNASGDTLTLTTPTETKNVNLVVLVAGGEINGQTRSDKTDIINYLEDENADGDEHFISQPVTDDFNDVVCWNSDCIY